MSNLAYLNEYNRWFHLNSLYFLHYRYEYDYETAPNEVKAIESKVFTAGERLSEVINKINYNHQINGESDKTFFDTFEVILEGIQEMELIRLKEIKNSLIDFAESVKKMRIGVFDSEQKLFTEVENYNPKQEIQSYISNKSRYQDLEDIVSLYRQKGMILLI